MFFLKEHCNTCKNRKACGVKNQKNHAVVTITPKTIARAQYLAKLSTEEYKELTRMRNAVEGVPSVLRRRYHVDQIPVRGFVRSKAWFTMKIGAINVKRVLAMVLSPLVSPLFNQLCSFFDHLEQLTTVNLRFRIAYSSF